MRTIANLSLPRQVLLLWAVLLLSAETLAVGHDHAADGPAAPCAVCTLAKNQIAAGDTAAPTMAPLLRPAASRTLPGESHHSTLLPLRTARGPPGH